MWWKTAVMTAVLAALAALVAGGGARELDPAACAARFDVQRDKIIRTEESREMGAHYLSELDVGARHECLRLCCETEACDVFVYEEKGPGSCYLFECGPPEDFRCKFTAHSNFSSGVLALSRRLAELQDQELRAHHERELNRLRSGSSTTVSTTTAISEQGAAPPRPPPPAPLIHPHPPDPQEPPRRCSRYQFECRRGGECIAVYNACDGVPQCADGSDEAPELGCPAASVVPAAATAPPPPPTSPSTTLLVPLQEDGGAGGIGEGVGNSVAAGRWPHRLTQAQVQSQHRYTVPENAVSSHIFSHKGGLVQEPESGAQFPPYDPPALAPVAPAPPLWSRRPWPLQPLQLQPGMENVPEERGWAGPAGAGYWTDPDPRRAWPVPQQRPDPDMPVYLPPKTMPEIPVQYGIQRQALRDGPKKGFDLNTKLDPTESPPPPPHSRPPASHPSPNEKKQSLEKDNTKKLDIIKNTEAAANKPGVIEQGTGRLVEAHRHYSLEEHEEHEGLSERPPAAVLLLVLGVLMTSVLGAMLGCRARAARRRLRRGKSSFAHDADYLVNGMYL